MGGACSCGTNGEKPEMREKTRGLSWKLRSIKSFNKKKESSVENPKLDSNNSSNEEDKYESNRMPLQFSSELKPSIFSKIQSSKATQNNSFLGRAGAASLEKAVEVLDRLGSRMSSLNLGNGFISGMTYRGNQVSILAFEVANTVAKGATLLQSLSEENLKLLKKDISRSKGVRKLVSTDMKELLSITASDKREELDVFSREVIRFGNLCKDPQWHNLDRYFSKLVSDHSHHKQLRDEEEMRMQELVSLVHHTADLYHELQALDRFEQDYRRKLEEIEALNLPRKGEGITILQNELKQQRNFVKDLKQKSLWSKNLEEIMEKLVDVVICIHQTITEAFGNKGCGEVDKRLEPSTERLGEASLALHYANMIQQIDSIASRPSSIPHNVRDMLYNALPASVKTALRSRLKMHAADEELSVSEIKAEMEKTLRWLVPLATNTTKTYQGFGWVGEWANTGMEFGRDKTTNTNLTRLQTLYHADKHKMDSHILELVIWLHRLISSVRKRDHGMKYLPVQSPSNTGLNVPISKTQLSLSPNYTTYNKTRKTELSLEDRFVLERVCEIRSSPGISKSQEFVILKNKKKGTKVWALSRSMGCSPNKDLSGRGVSEHSTANFLDVLDGLDSEF